MSTPNTTAGTGPAVYCIAGNALIDQTDPEMTQPSINIIITPVEPARAADQRHPPWSWRPALTPPGRLSVCPSRRWVRKRCTRLAWAVSNRDLLALDVSPIISGAVFLSTRNTTRHKFSHLLSSAFISCSFPWLSQHQDKHSLLSVVSVLSLQGTTKWILISALLIYLYYFITQTNLYGCLFAQLLIFLSTYWSSGRCFRLFCIHTAILCNQLGWYN